MNTAVGAKPGSRTLRVTASQASSSFYEPGKIYAERYRNVLSPVREVKANIDTLDRIGDRYVVDNDRTFMKIDVQCAELDVIEGGSGYIPSCWGLKVESSLAPVYEGAPVMEDVIARLSDLGFVPVWMSPGFKDPET